MKKTIWKFAIEYSKAMILLPKDAEILTVQIQNEDPYIWALVNPNNEKVERCFEIFGTGHDIHFDMGIEIKYINTFQHCSFVYHLFERIN